MNKDMVFKPAYKPEIDGLRALAVIAVIINHINKDILPSGYLGVDIFFVISGFVITSSLANRPSKNFRDFLAGFYNRRIKRLVPALVLFVLITSVLICLFNPLPVISLRTGITSLFGLSNLYLLKQSTDYFAASTELNIFTHTWSLGVEEQFYFLFPFLVWFTGFGRQATKGSRNLFWVMMVFSVASLISFVYIYQTNQAAAYFLMPTRLWELGAGCLLFLGLKHSNWFLRTLESIPPLMVAGAVVAVLFIPLQFAVQATIAVVVLTAVLITCLRSGTAAHNLFTHPQVVYIGLISYSLYLWHWGVLSLSRWTIGIHWWSVPIQIALIFLLAFVSYQYVETPLRRGEWSLVRWKSIIYGLGASATVSVLLLALTIPILGGHLYTGRANDMEKTYLKTSDSPIFNSCNIFDDGIRASSIADSCGIGNQANKPTIFFLGDSHAEQFVLPATKFARRNGYNLRAVWGNSCLFPSSVVREAGKYGKDGGSGTDCFHSQLLVEQSLLSKVKPGDVIFIASALYVHFTPSLPGQDGKLQYSLPTGKSISITTAVSEYSSSIRSLAEKIVERGGKTVIYLDSAQFTNLKEGEGELCNPEWFRPILKVNCTVDKHSYIAQIDNLFGWLHHWADDKYRFVWNGIDETTCDANRCVAAHYVDSNHFKGYYADFIFRKFVSQNATIF